MLFVAHLTDVCVRKQTVRILAVQKVNNKKAIQAYLITGKETGNSSFDLTNWSTVSGGTSKNMYVTDGVLSIE